MRRSIRLAQSLALVAVSLCVFVPPVGAQECPQLRTAMRELPVAYGKISVSDGYAYVSGYGGYLSVLDLTSPLYPVDVWTGILPCDDLAATLDVDVADGIVYHLFVHNCQVGHLTSPPMSLMRVIDARDPAAPVALGEILGFGQGVFYPESLEVSEGYAYLAGCYSCDKYSYQRATHHGLKVIDVMEPSSPVEIGQFSYYHPKYPPPGNASLAVAGGFAYLVVGTRLTVIDVMVPSSPVEVGSLDLTDVGECLAVSGNHAYFAGPTGLRVVDVSTPSEPFEEGFIAIPGYFTAIEVAGRLVYLTKYDGLQVIDVRTPSSPVEVGSAELAWPWDVAASGRYAYVVSEEGLSVFDTWSCTHPWQQQMPLAVE